MANINASSSLLAAISSFILGGLWYSPVLFGRTWVRENGREMQSGHPARVFGVSFLLALLAAVAFGYLLDADPSVGEAVKAGLLVGLCFVATSFGINYQFAQRSTLLWAIDGGYHVAQFALFGLVFGLWP